MTRDLAVVKIERTADSYLITLDDPPVGDRPGGVAIVRVPTEDDLPVEEVLKRARGASAPTEQRVHTVPVPRGSRVAVADTTERPPAPPAASGGADMTERDLNGRPIQSTAVRGPNA